MKIWAVGTLLLLCLSTNGFSEPPVIEIVSSQITYIDDQTVAGKAVERELKSYSDHEYWSKPELVHLSVKIKNNGDKNIKARVTPELYVLIQSTGQRMYPGVSGSTGEPSVFDKPVWVWNRVLQSKPPVAIPAGGVGTVTFKDLNISNPYYPTEFSISAFAVRVFVESHLNKPPRFNIVSDHVISYGD